MLKHESVALVTGGARGIGRATALAFANSGAHVVLSDLHDADGEAVAEEIRSLGRQARYIHCDVSDEDSVTAMMQAVNTEFGRLDYACNNAGIEGEQAPTADSPLENFDRVLSVNLRGVFLCLKAELTAMTGNEGGAIVNMASVAALVGFPGLPAYCASKGGVVQLTKTAALEYAEQGIRVNAVCPGAVQTEMIDRITGAEAEAVEQFRQLHPMNRFATPQEIADTVLWLCSEGSGFITGQALAVDGGMVAR